MIEYLLEVQGDVVGEGGDEGPNISERFRQEIRGG